MRAMRRARISSAATREAWSSCRHAVASGAAGGFGARSGGSRKASFNCMTALLWRRRLDMSAAQSVDDLAKVKQIAEPAQIVVAIGLLRAPDGERVMDRLDLRLVQTGRNLLRPAAD